MRIAIPLLIDHLVLRVLTSGRQPVRGFVLLLPVVSVLFLSCLGEARGGEVLLEQLQENEQVVDVAFDPQEQRAYILTGTRIFPLKPDGSKVLDGGFQLKSGETGIAMAAFDKHLYVIVQTAAGGSELVDLVFDRSRTPMIAEADRLAAASAEFRDVAVAEDRAVWLAEKTGTNVRLRKWPVNLAGNRVQPIELALIPAESGTDPQVAVSGRNAYLSINLLGGANKSGAFDLGYQRNVNVNSSKLIASLDAAEKYAYAADRTTVPTIDLNGSSVPAMNSDDFAAHLSGWWHLEPDPVNPTEERQIEFGITANDYARLVLVDSKRGKIKIDQTAFTSDANVIATKRAVALTPGLVKIDVYFLEDGGGNEWIRVFQKPAGTGDTLDTGDLLKATPQGRPVESLSAQPILNGSGAVPTVLVFNAAAVNGEAPRGFAFLPMRDVSVKELAVGAGGVYALAAKPANGNTLVGEQLGVFLLDPESLELRNEASILAQSSNAKLNADSMAAIPGGDVFMLARSTPGALQLRDSTTTKNLFGNFPNNYLLARLDPTRLTWERQVMLPDQGNPETLGPGGVVWNYNQGRTQLIIAGSLQKGSFNPNQPGQPRPSGEKPNEITAANAKAPSFYTLADSSQLKLVEQPYLRIKAVVRRPDGKLEEVPVAPKDVLPEDDVSKQALNSRVQVEMPEHVYVRSVKGPNNEITFEPVELFGRRDDDIKTEIEKSDVVRRYTPATYSVTRAGQSATTTGTGKAIEVVMTGDTTVTFFFKTEHALTIDSKVTDVDLSPANALALGNPDPPVKKHWFPENELIVAKIDGIATSTDHVGTRFVVTGYEASGAAGQSTAWDDAQLRQQVPQFTLTGPASIRYLWEKQHSITVSTSLSRAEALPGVSVKEPGAAGHAFLAPGGEGTTAGGSGTYWIKSGSEVLVGASDKPDDNLSMHGVLNSTGALIEASGLLRPSFTKARNEQHLVKTQEFTIGNKPYRAIAIDRLEQGAHITWHYGNTIYRKLTPIGKRVELALPQGEELRFDADELLTQAVIDEIDLTRPPRVVSVLDAPPGGTAETMTVWSPVPKTDGGGLFPVRPGRFLVEWRKAGDEREVITTEVTSGFGGDRIRHPFFLRQEIQVAFPGQPRDYRALLHPVMPDIELDREAEDGFAFLGLKFSSTRDTDVPVADLRAPAILPTISEKRLSFSVAANNLPDAEGKHVLVWTQSLAGVASGDVSREKPVVRVLETRRWNSELDWSEEDKPENLRNGTKMQVTATQTATIGSKLQAPVTNGFDKAGLGTGFVATSLASYNVHVYDRAAVAGAGPIIPVNQHFTNDPERDLVVIWYEKQIDEPPVYWPWKPVKHPVRWPEELNSGRIVIASRLGSEAPDLKNPPLLSDAEGRPSRVFSGDRYTEVKIYQQPDSTKPGYNPNEEHALVATSLQSAAANPPLAAFALRPGDLNVGALAVNKDADPGNDVAHDAYTSEPRVLVQYFDKIAGEPGMAVYRIAKDDDTIPALQKDVAVDQITSDQGGILFTSPNHGFLDGESVRVTFDGTFTGLVSEATYFIRASGPNTFSLAARLGGSPIALGADKASISVARRFPFVFDYSMLAGQLVQPPYPLGQVIGLTPCKETFGENVASRRTYWEDYTGQAWAVSEGKFNSFFYYPLQPAFWFEGQAPGTCIPFLPDKQNQDRPEQIAYSALWPEELPILKVGETLTFAGGEYRADHPQNPGLPGVLGWASGKVVFDELNPDPDLETERAFTDYAGRLIAPLEERKVSLRKDLGLDEAKIQAFKDKIAPATGIVEVDGLVWRFAKLPASLKKRIFFDPIGNTLGIRGYVNDKTLGDSTLTQVPPPVYVLEPNILTKQERQQLETFKANRAEDKTIAELTPVGVWTRTVAKLYKSSRNPEELQRGDDDAYYVGLERHMKQRSDGGDELDSLTGKPIPFGPGARHKNQLGPGLALVPSPLLLDPTRNFDATLYLTLAENDDKEIGGPVSLHIVKIEKKHRYRGAIKTILSPNVFDEKITLRHTADFGGNGDDVVYQWFYRQEDGGSAPLPPDVPWNLFKNGAGLYQVGVAGSPTAMLPDNLFFLRYRHKNDVPPGKDPATFAGTNWTGTDWETDGRPETGSKIGELWAGAGNSPTVDGDYRPQLVQGWVKRVLDRVNLYEARYNNFRDNAAPAGYVSMIQQAGQRYEGAVALNADKDVVENVGLIELYQTVLDRARSLSIDMRPAVRGPAITNALQLAATRVQDLYVLLGNEAYADAQDPTIGFGSDSAEYGSAASSIWTFMNQTGSSLDEELSLLRGISDSYRRPVYNRLFWNFVKDRGEVAYGMTYNLSDENRDGFVDENDARLRYPQGHGDAWGHYTFGLRMHYDLLRHQEYQWQPRAELYNLLDIVIPVDFLDERKFARAAASRAKAGAQIVDLTYRSNYLDSAGGQWQPLADADTERAWGTQDWALRAGQGAYFDWVTANSLIPAVDKKHAMPEFIDGNGKWDDQEPFTDANSNGKWDNYELFTDANDNGRWDDREPFTDVNNNGEWDDHEPFTDANENGQRDDGELFTDVNGNGTWDDAESFIDIDSNGKWDDRELFTDVNENGVWDDHETFTDANGNGQWDDRESFTDVNNNGRWDEGEPLSDGNGTWEDSEPFTDANGNGIWDAQDPTFTLPGKALQRVDRHTVTSIKRIPAEYAKIEDVLESAIAGMNPVGLAGDAVPFDIDPLAFAGRTGIPTVSHFEQIYSRAVEATKNASTVFDRATEYQNNIRGQQDRADAFKNEVVAGDRDLRNQLIKIFGTPYEGLIGTGKPYPAGYKGPDLFFYMYVDVQDVNGETVPKHNEKFQFFWDGFSQQVVDFTGDINSSIGQADRNVAKPVDIDGDLTNDFREVFQKFFINDIIGADTATRRKNLAAITNVDFVKDNSVLELNLPITASGYSFQAEPEWGRRGVTGELQSIISDLVQAQAALALSVGDYDVLVSEFVDQAQLLEAAHGKKLFVLQRGRDDVKATEIQTYNAQAARSAAAVLRYVTALPAEIADQSTDGIPQVFGAIVGMSNGTVVDPQSISKNAVTGAFVGKKVGEFGGLVLDEVAEYATIEHQFQSARVQLEIDEKEISAELRGPLKELEASLRNEGTTRIEVFQKLEALRQFSDAYRSKLHRGLAVLAERHDFNRLAAGTVQEVRYRDMAFRVFRNDALERYRAAFDHAARYTYLAAKAYDYETNLAPSAPGSAQPVVEDIIKARGLGALENGEPVAGSGGLADALARMRDNFSVLNGQLGINNAQAEESKISLRWELFRIPHGANCDEQWREVLQKHRVDDLRTLPEFRRLCRPFAPHRVGKQPGIAIQFRTEILAEHNVFGKPLRAHDHAFDPTLYATKIRGVGVWFQNYDKNVLARAPRVYLVPAGLDVMSVPNSWDMQLRTWNVLDQRIPVPFPARRPLLGAPAWVPTRDTLTSRFGEHRRFSSFRAFGDIDCGCDVKEAELSFDSRLVGRSVWNTKWMLIIPSAALHSEDRKRSGVGVDKFINGAHNCQGVEDIQLYFKTFGFSGN